MIVAIAYALGILGATGVYSTNLFAAAAVAMIHRHVVTGAESGANRLGRPAVLRNRTPALDGKDMFSVGAEV